MYENLLVYIIRHGETNENRLGIIQGQMDTQLNDAGRAQAELTGKHLKDVKFVKAYSSDSSRAADTARAIVAYHPGCELVLDPRIRERNMGSLSGTKAPAKRPLPPGVETSKSVEARLLDFWGNTIVPMLSPSAATLSKNESLNTEPGTDLSGSSVARHTDSGEVRTPAVLLVSHGATISKLIVEVLLRTYDYKLTCQMQRGIYNTSISIVRMSVTETIPQSLSSDEESGAEENRQAMVPVVGILVSIGSIAHLIRKHELVVENADAL